MRGCGRYCYVCAWFVSMDVYVCVVCLYGFVYAWFVSMDVYMCVVCLCECMDVYMCVV